ncbi:putative E3 ubiquitin-protein ligase [Forsythia ovata]|uniref:E3 ubiquitin-protein ligase n=1 Tax=Forsythia ovata TaxID=205694 RepID=A0ABD1R4H8_9LAMI
MPVGHHFRGRRRLRPKRRPVRGAGVEHPPQVHQRTHEEELGPDQFQVKEHIQIMDLDSDDSGTDPEEFGEFVTLQLSELRDNVQCPICLGIIKRTRTVMGCLHRFCRECIDKSIRLGNNECPACRMHCASRRSMRNDLGFDALISSVYTDVEKYEEEELVLQEEERTCNQQIQETIAQISHRQSEALAKVPTTSKETASLSRLRVPCNSQNAYSRRKNNQSTRIQAFDENEGENCTEGNSSSPIDEHQIEVRQRRRDKPTSILPGQTSLRALNGAKVSETTTGPATEDMTGSPSPSNLDTLNWARGGARSRTRHGQANGSKATRSNRIPKLADHLASSGKNEEHPMITALAQGVQIIWKKNNCAPNLNSSSSMDVLKPPPPHNVVNWASNKSVLQILEGREIPRGHCTLP